GPVDEEEERVQPLGAGLVGRVGAVEVRLCHPSLVELVDPPPGPVLELGQRPELDGLGGAGLRAGGGEALAQAVVAERALPRPAVVGSAVDDTERAADDAVPAAVADVGLDVDRAEL